MPTIMRDWYWLTEWIDWFVGFLKIALGISFNTLFMFQLSISNRLWQRSSGEVKDRQVPEASSSVIIRRKMLVEIPTPLPITGNEKANNSVVFNFFVHLYPVQLKLATSWSLSHFAWTEVLRLKIRELILSPFHSNFHLFSHINGLVFHSFFSERNDSFKNGFSFRW